jgi:hypothetical protein
MDIRTEAGRLNGRSPRKIVAFLGCAIIATLSAGLAASIALAGPQFNPTSGVTIAGSGGASLFQANNGTEKVLCTANTSSGVISSATLAGGFVVKLTGCTSASPTKANCSVSSKTSGGAAGSITTETLHGVLGTILPSGRAGLLLLPTTGKKWYTLQENACTVEAAATGNLAGEYEPLGSSQKTGKLVFTTKAGGAEQAVTDFDPSTGGLVVPGFVSFGTTGIWHLLLLWIFSAFLEVT